MRTHTGAARRVPTVRPTSHQPAADGHEPHVEITRIQIQHHGRGVEDEAPWVPSLHHQPSARDEVVPDGLRTQLLCSQDAHARFDRSFTDEQPHVGGSRSQLVDHDLSVAPERRDDDDGPVITFGSSRSSPRRTDPLASVRSVANPSRASSPGGGSTDWSSCPRPAAAAHQARDRCHSSDCTSESTTASKAEPASRVWRPRSPAEAHYSGRTCCRPLGKWACATMGGSCSDGSGSSSRPW